MPNMKYLSDGNVSYAVADAQARSDIDVLNMGKYNVLRNNTSWNFYKLSNNEYSTGIVSGFDTISNNLASSIGLTQVSEEPYYSELVKVFEPLFNSDNYGKRFVLSIGNLSYDYSGDGGIHVQGICGLPLTASTAYDSDEITGDTKWYDEYTIWSLQVRSKSLELFYFSRGNTKLCLSANSTRASIFDMKNDKAFDYIPEVKIWIERV